MRLLIIKPSSLGDIIHSLPVAQSIREQLPDAEISWVVKSRFADIVERCPTVNGEVIRFDHKKKFAGIQPLVQTIRTLRSREYDAVLDFQGLLRTGLMTRAAKAPLKIGSVFAREGSRYAYNRHAAAPAGGFETHAIEKLLQFLPVLGLEPSLRSPVQIIGDDPQSVDQRLADAAPVVMIPNSRGVHKEWKHFPELTSLLLSERPETLIAWDSHIRWEDPATDHLSRFINLTSRTSLMEMVEVIRSASLVIANDSGPMHIAAALGKPTLALFGPTSPDRFGPFPPEQGTNHVLCAPDGDLDSLPTEAVAEKVCEILDSQWPQQAAA